MKKVILTVVSAALATMACAQVSVQPVGITPVETSTVPVTYNQARKVAKIESNQRWVGYYSSDALAENGMGIPSYPGDNKAGICLDAEKLQPYAGMQIVGIRFGLCADIGGSRVFINEVKDQKISDNDVVEQTVANAVTGWNEVKLDNPYTITGDANTALLIGYDYTQSGNNQDLAAYPFSAVQEGDANQYLYVYCNNTQQDGWGWYRFTMGGRNMSIQVLVQGDFAEYSVTPEDFGQVTGSINNNVDIPIRFFNASATAVTSLDYVVTVDGVAGEEQHAAIDPAVGQGSNGSFRVSVPCGSVDARKEVQVEVTKVNGEENGSKSRIAKGSVGVSSSQYPRNLVIEEFTTEQCPNCPRVAGYMDEYFETADVDHVYGVCHHSAFYTDWLTKQCDQDLTYLFNDAGYTYAPAVMFNREPDFESAYAKGEKDNMTIPSSANEIEQIANYYLTQTLANAKLDMEVVPTEDLTQVTLKISGEANMAYQTDDALLTVYVTEDNIAAKSQSGASGKFIHQHVIRDYNSSWGDRLTWNDNKFTATYTFDLENEWKKDDIRFVAFLNKHNASDVLDNRIENSIGTSLKNAVNAVEGVSANNNAVEVARYNAAGQQIKGQQKGLNIVKLSDGRTLKVIVK